MIHLYVHDIDAVSQEFQIRVDEEGSLAVSATSLTRTAIDCESRRDARKPGTFMVNIPLQVPKYGGVEGNDVGDEKSRTVVIEFTGDA